MFTYLEDITDDKYKTDIHKKKQRHIHIDYNKNYKKNINKKTKQKK